MSKSVYRKIVTEIRRRAEQAGTDTEAARRHHALMSKEPGSRTRGLRAPEVHALIRELKPKLLRLDVEDRFDLALYLTDSRYEEEAALAVALIEMSLEEIRPPRFDFLDAVMDRCVNWPLCDGFSLSVLQPLLTKYPTGVLKLLRRWNRDANLWKRRASVVAFARNTGKSGAYIEQVLELCENLLFDPEDLVLKGVGWALKDNLRGNHNRVLSFIKSCRERGVSSVVTLYAMRDLRGDERAELLAVKPR